MSQAHEQFRAGFEAAYPFAKEVRGRDGSYQGVMGIRWETWCAAKREASTEPSAGYLTACKMGNMLFNLGQVDDMPEPWRSKAREMVAEWDANRKTGMVVGALTDEAKDAARYRFLRDAKWFKEGFAKTEPQASAFHYAGTMLDSKIDAAIAGHTKGEKP